MLLKTKLYEVFLRKRLGWYDSPPQTWDVMVPKPEVAWLDFIFLSGNFGIVSDEADLGEENLEGYSAKPKWI